MASAGEEKIDLYPLAIESEWLILGQEFPVLKPGESVETLVASEPVSEDRFERLMTWQHPAANRALSHGHARGSVHEERFLAVMVPSRCRAAP